MCDYHRREIYKLVLSICQNRGILWPWYFRPIHLRKVVEIVQQCFPLSFEIYGRLTHSSLFIIPQILIKELPQNVPRRPTLNLQTLKVSRIKPVYQWSKLVISAAKKCLKCLTIQFSPPGASLPYMVLELTACRSGRNLYNPSVLITLKSARNKKSSNICTLIKRTNSSDTSNRIAASLHYLQQLTIRTAHYSPEPREALKRHKELNNVCFFLYRNESRGVSSWEISNVYQRKRCSGYKLIISFRHERQAGYMLFVAWIQWIQCIRRII